MSRVWRYLVTPAAVAALRLPGRRVRSRRRPRRGRGSTVGLLALPREAQVFVACLPCSNLVYAETTWTQGQEDWLGSHVRALSAIGGCPEKLVPDNPSALTETDPLLLMGMDPASAHEFVVRWPDRSVAGVVGGKFSFVCPGAMPAAGACTDGDPGMKAVRCCRGSRPGQHVASCHGETGTPPAAAGSGGVGSADVAQRPDHAIDRDVAAAKPQPFVRRRAASARRIVGTPSVPTPPMGHGVRGGSKAPRACLRGGSGATRRKSALADFRAWRAAAL